MARHGVSEAQRRAAALRAGHQMVSRGERPLYRLRPEDGGWTVDGLTWLSVAATGRPEALGEARAVIAQWLDLPADSFDLEA